MNPKRYFLLGLCACFALAASAGEPLWQAAVPVGEPYVVPHRYAVFAANAAALDALLQTAPDAPDRAVQLALPQPDGSLRTFRVWNTPIGDAAFGRLHPDIQTFTGAAADDPAVTVKLDRTGADFHALILDGRTLVFIDPYNRTATDRYLVYDRRDLSIPDGARGVCGVEGTVPVAPPAGGASKLNGTVRRTYRLALACTGEYAVAVAGAGAPTKAQVLAAMVTSINRVNGVYEREVAVTLQLIGNTSDIIFLNAATDPYSNNSNASTLLNENQGVVDQYIGTANYDIGHVFSTGSGGQASLASACKSSGKARGTTGRSNPVGDAFDIDYVAHEFGHQFGADHTFNAATGSCSGNGEAASAYEPGAGTTIMAYAGICGSGDNTQSNSDAYFHTRSLDQITTYITSPQIAACPVTAVTSNVPPVVPAYQHVYYVPWMTPFEIQAPEATDATHTGPLTYCWEEWDLGQFGASFGPTRYAGPIFRSFTPDTSRTRVFPTPRRLVRNTYSYLGEKLPDTARAVRFSLTVRDVLNGIGSFNWVNSDTIRLVVVQAPDTFRVLSHNEMVPIGPNDLNQTVTWAVSNTASAPINCAAVDIFYSTDSGYTWPYLLKAGTPNDGSESVTFPNLATTAGRIKVKASDNVFFDINDQPLTVTNGPASVGASYGLEGVSVFPVPAASRVTVRMPEHAGGFDGVISNAVGQPVWTGRFDGSRTLSVSDWPRGMYLLRLVDPATGVQTRRRFILD